MEMIQKTQAARLKAQTLQPLEQLCIKSVAVDAIHKYSFGNLPPGLLDLVVQELLKKYEESSRYPRIPNILAQGLMNVNLRTFSCWMVKASNPTLFDERWDQLTQNCGRLNAIISKCSTISRRVLKDLHFFPKLEQLSLLDCDTPLRCKQMESLPDLAPNLRILEIETTDIDICCQERLCVLDLEQFAFGFSRNFFGLHLEKRGRLRDFYSSRDFSILAAAFLQKMPRLRILSQEPLQKNNLPCLGGALDILKEQGHERPLQLTHLGLKWSGKGKLEELPLHLMSSVFSLSIGFSSADSILFLARTFGPHLTELKVDSGCSARMKATLIASLCPKLEVPTFTGCSEREDGVLLPEGHFDRLRRFTLDGSAEVSEHFLQRVFESPVLEYVFSGMQIETYEILNTVSNEGLFKNLLEFRVCLHIDKDDDAEDYAHALKSLLAAAPRLTLLEVNVAYTGYEENKILEELLAEESRLFTGLRINILCDEYHSDYSDE